MNYPTLHQITVPFAQLNSLANQLRQAGACFNVTSAGDNRILQFRKITPAVQGFLTTVELPVFSYSEFSLSKATETVTLESKQYATLEEIMNKNKREIKQLAEQFNISINPKSRKEEMAKALVGKVVI